MENILREPLTEYLNAKKSPFSKNSLADKFRHLFPNTIRQILPDKMRYKVEGSPGQGQWAECPWIAIFDILITDSAQSGYYPVFLFKADMTGVYLSLNQGITKVKDYYKRETKNVLRLRAQDYRAKVNLSPNDLLEIKLEANGDAKLYEDGNIVAKYYSTDNIPSSEVIKADILRFLNLYDELAFNDTELVDNKKLTAIEKKQYQLHYRIERNTNISKEVKRLKGSTCEACGFEFKTKYGEIGVGFIEAHHLKPISTLGIGKFVVNLENDFAVLCSNCHSMIHRLKNPSNLDELKKTIQNNSLQ